MNKIIVNHSYISIPDYTMGDCVYLENTLSIYDKTYHKMIPRAYVYIEETRELRIPSGIDPNHIGRLLNRNVEVNFTPDEYLPAVFNLKTEPRDDLQKKSIGFLIGEGDFKNTKKYSQLSLSIQTDGGKTYCTITALTFIRHKSIIIANSEKVRKQWVKRFPEYTDISPTHVYVIDSSAKITALLKYKGIIPYKSFITIHRTIGSYAKRYGWDKITELFKKLGVGVTIFDEAHLEFDNLVRVLCHTNVKKTIYLTANFERSEFRENKLFQFCFKSIPKYIQKERDVDIKSKGHIVGIAHIYNSQPSMVSIVKCKNKYGFDKNEFAKYQMDKDGDIFPILNEYINFFTINKKLKTLIIVTSIEGCIIVNDYIKDNFSNIKTGMYHSKISNAIKDRNIEVCDIIVSTSKSLGTGADIDKLKTVINIEPYRSLITANQIPGRLRKIDDEPSYYIEIINKGFHSIFDQFKTRLKLFKESFNSMKMIDKTKK